jgi:hypothetical protein
MVPQLWNACAISHSSPVASAEDSASSASPAARSGLRGAS